MNSMPNMRVVHQAPTGELIGYQVQPGGYGTEPIKYFYQNVSFESPVEEQNSDISNLILDDWEYKIHTGNVDDERIIKLVDLIARLNSQERSQIPLNLKSNDDLPPDFKDLHKIVNTIGLNSNNDATKTFFNIFIREERRKSEVKEAADRASSARRMAHQYMRVVHQASDVRFESPVVEEYGMNVESKLILDGREYKIHTANVTHVDNKIIKLVDLIAKLNSQKRSQITQILESNNDHDLGFNDLLGIVNNDYSSIYKLDSYFFKQPKGDLRDCLKVYIRALCDYKHPYHQFSVKLLKAVTEFSKTSGNSASFKAKHFEEFAHWAEIALFWVQDHRIPQIIIDACLKE